MGLLITRVRSAETTSSGAPAELSLRDRARTLLVAAFGPLVTVYATVAAVLALVSALAPHARFSAPDTLLAAGPGLLTVYQAPVEIGGYPLSVLPLLPTIGACLLIARTARGAAAKLGCREPGQAAVVVAPIAGVHASAGALIASLSSSPAFSAGPLSTLLILGVVVSVSALIGVSGPCGIAASVRRFLNPVARRGLRAGMLGLACLFAAGAVTFTIGLLFSLPTAHELFATGATGTGGAFGMLVLSVSYLPNAMVAGAGVAAGPGFSMGGLSVSPFGFTSGPLPAVPLLAGVPEAYAGWWPLLLLLPLACGLLVGFSLRDVAEHATTRLRALGIAAVLAALGVVLLATLAGGSLGAGPVSPVEIPPGLFSLAVFGWIVVSGGLVVWFAGPHPAVSLPRIRPLRTQAGTREDEPQDSDQESPWDAEHPAETETPRQDDVAQDDTDSDCADSDSADSDCADSDCADSDSAGVETDDSDCADSESADDSDERD